MKVERMSDSLYYDCFVLRPETQCENHSERVANTSVATNALTRISASRCIRNLSESFRGGRWLGRGREKSLPWFGCVTQSLTDASQWRCVESSSASRRYGPLIDLQAHKDSPGHKETHILVSNNNSCNTSPNDMYPEAEVTWRLVSSDACRWPEVTAARANCAARHSRRLPIAQAGGLRLTASAQASTQERGQRRRMETRPLPFSALVLMLITNRRPTRNISNFSPRHDLFLHIRSILSALRDSKHVEEFCVTTQF